METIPPSAGLSVHEVDVEKLPLAVPGTLRLWVVSQGVGSSPDLLNLVWYVVPCLPRYPSKGGTDSRFKVCPVSGVIRGGRLESQQHMILGYVSRCLGAHRVRSLFSGLGYLRLEHPATSSC